MVVATSVKMRESDKARLDRLQAKLVGLTGKKMPQDVLLARLVTLGEADLDALAGLEAKPRKEAVLTLFQLPVRTGIRTSEEEIDPALYGSGA